MKKYSNYMIVDIHERVRFSCHENSSECTACLHVKLIEKFLVCVRVYVCAHTCMIVQLINRDIQLFLMDHLDECEPDKMEEVLIYSGECFNRLRLLFEFI